MQRVLIVLFFVAITHVHAQTISRLHVEGKFASKKTFLDSLHFSKYIRKLQMDWISDGYYFAGVDSITSHAGINSIYLHKGEKLHIYIGGIKKKNILKEFNLKLDRYVDHGYPFASLSLDSVIILEQNLAGALHIEKGPEIRYDSAHFFRQPSTKQSYLHQLLDIVPGNIFSEMDYSKIEKKIERSPFLTLNRPQDISFGQHVAKIFLDISEQESNTFQGIIGLQEANSSKASVVGSLNLNVQNLFRSGKQLRFFWERFAKESQRLSLFYKHPFFLNSSISPSFRFDLFKQDTTFLTRITGVGFSTYISPTTNLFLEFEKTNGSLLSLDPSAINGKRLADFKRTVYRLEVSAGYIELLEKLREKIIWNISVGIGRKNVIKNSNLSDTYYDSIKLETNFYQVATRVAYQIKIGKRQSIFHDVKTGAFHNEEALTNEFYRLGGLTSLRGFNEKSIFAQYYGISRLEVRSFFEEKSYVYLFIDQLLYKREAHTDSPLGVGMGFVLATSYGQFSFALATGQSKDQDISFSELRVHFGYISRF